MSKKGHYSPLVVWNKSESPPATLPPPSKIYEVVLDAKYNKKRLDYYDDPNDSAI